MVEAVRRQVGSGFAAVIISSLFFSTSGTFAKALLATGWSPLAVVTIRVGGAALLLLPWTLMSLHGRWRELRGQFGLVIAYGFFAITAAQLGYFAAVAHLDVGVALLIEYLGIVLVVLWVWAWTRRTPHVFTLCGVVLAIAGLVLVLDLTGAAPPNLIGVLWALLAATGMGGHFVIAARPTRIPTVAFAGLGLLIGTVLLALAGLVGLVPLRAGQGPVTLSGVQVPAWVAFVELALVAGAASYLIAIAGARRLGSTLASFVGLSEVLFAALIAWLLLGEAPSWMQALGGLLMLGGVVAVRLGELRRERDDAQAPTAAEGDADATPGVTASMGSAGAPSISPVGSAVVEPGPEAIAR